MSLLFAFKRGDEMGLAAFNRRRRLEAERKARKHREQTQVETKPAKKPAPKRKKKS